MTALRKITLLVFLPLLCLRPQFHLQKEEIINHQYRLSYASGKKISPAARHDSPVSRELFIALPPTIIPTIVFTPTELRESEHLEGSREIPVSSSWYTINGYLWIQDQYCVHISVYPVANIKSKIFEMTAFTIEFSHNDGFSQQGIVSASATSDLSSFIENPSQGRKWKSLPRESITHRTDHWIDYTADYVKLGVANDGIYRIRYQNLLSYGVPAAGIDPASFKMFFKGREIPLFVSGESDNKFDQNDYIEFVGRRNYGDVRYRSIAPTGSSYFEYLNPYSDTAVYWLTWGGRAGKRLLPPAPGDGLPADTLRHYDQLLHRENNLFWDFSLQGDDIRKNYPEILENETWHEGNMGVGTVSIPFTVTDRFPSKPARAFVKLQDFASGVSTKAHLLALSVNNGPTRYDSGFINKYQGKVLQADFSSNVLVNGSNSVDIHSFNVPGNPVNTVIRDWYELEYPRHLITDSDSLTFAYTLLGSSQYSAFVITGVSPGEYALYKFVMHDSSLYKLTSFTLSHDTLQFIDSVSNGMQYFLLRSDKVPAPIFYYKKRFTNLRNLQRQADYIAITHPSLMNAAVSYVSFVQSHYGVATALVDVNDIYDEYNDGFFAPEPIREFLRSTITYWQLPKPKYVCLIGKATYDYFGNKSKYFGAPRQPPLIPSFGNPVSDSWFIQWDSTGASVPQMNIGRLPVRTVEELQSYMVKHQRYVDKGYDEWNKSFLFFSGGSIADTVEMAAAKGVNDYIIAQYVAKPPIGGKYANFYKTRDPVTNFGPYSPTFVADAIAQGGVFISYIGHSGTQTWDNSITDISLLANDRDRNPLITDFGCSTAKHAEPDVTSFAELAVLSHNGQAIAYIGNSSLGFTTTAFSFPQIFYKTLLQETAMSLGEVHRRSKIEFARQNGSGGAFGLFLKTNALIGDPIVHLPLPTQPNLKIAPSMLSLAQEQTNDQQESIPVTIRYSNTGSVPDDSLTISIRDEYRGRIVYDTQRQRGVPLISDSIVIHLPIKGKPGEHILTVVVDALQSITEIDENDNSARHTIVVAATAIRPLTVDDVVNQSPGGFDFLNPSVSTMRDHFFVEISENPSFVSSKTITVPFDTFVTSVKTDQEYRGKRVWVRAKTEESSGAGVAVSYVIGSKKDLLLNDSVAFGAGRVDRVLYSRGQLLLDSNRNSIEVLSGGFNDGNTVVIAKNGQNYIPANYLRGHHVVLFDAATLHYEGYYRFDVFAGADVVTTYTAFLDSLDSSSLVVFGISDEGSQNISPALKNSIKAFGSRYIDSLVFRSSWSMIGRKGAAPGSVPEDFSRPFQGKAQALITTVTGDTAGLFASPVLGPVAEWNNAVLNFTAPRTGMLSGAVLGVRDNGQEDTVVYWNGVDTVLDLSGIAAAVYPRLRIITVLSRNPGEVSPVLSSLALDYTAPAELGMNYQTIQCFVSGENAPLPPGDSVLQGKAIDFHFKVFNAGEATARNVSVRVEAIWENGSVEPISIFRIDSVRGGWWREYVVRYNSSLGFGKRIVQVTVDPDSVVKEKYKDNNVFHFPFTILKNPSSPVLPNLSINQNGIRTATAPITDELDSLHCTILYSNTGTLINDSISIRIRHFYRSNLSSERIVRRKFPLAIDTFTISVPILKRSGGHSLQIDVDVVGLIRELNEDDNSASKHFTVLTTDFRIIQPLPISTSSFNSIIALNPTSSDPASSGIALLEIDSTDRFETKQSFQSAMQQYTSEFPISSLPKGRRYFWRLRQLNSLREWSSGSFYLGGASDFAIGQLDSVAWNINSYVRTAYVNGMGAHIVNTVYELRAQSAGFSDGLSGSLDLNGVNILSPILGAGHNISVLDSSTLALLAQRRFDLANNPAEADSLVDFISSVATGAIVAALIVDDGANHLTAAARQAYHSIGSVMIDSVGFRDSWAIIGRKGAAVGSVPEQFKKQGSGPAVAESLIERREQSGQITTPIFSALDNLGLLTIDAEIPSGAKMKTRVMGFAGSKIDTHQISPNALVIPLTFITASQYHSWQISYELMSNASFQSPMLRGWQLNAAQPPEFAAAAHAAVSQEVLMEGEQSDITAKLFNVSTVPADSIPIRWTLSQYGVETILKEEFVPSLRVNDSSTVALTFDSRGRVGEAVLRMEIDPVGKKLEVTKENNTVNAFLTVVGDTVRPQLSVLIDGQRVVNGDFIRQNPEVTILYVDDNPSTMTPADTANFTIRLNGTPVSFIAGSVDWGEMAQSGKGKIRWTPQLNEGKNIIELFADDLSGNRSDTTVYTLFVAAQFRLMNVYNFPNPFAHGTKFTFHLAGPITPEEAVIKIYTVTGRVIQELRAPAAIGFNALTWDGRDRDGDEIGNGVYLYRLSIRHQDRQVNSTSTMVKMK